MSVFIIAEAGVNHNGSHDMALALIDAAAEAGADAVKFQTFKAEAIAAAHAPKAGYQQQTTDAAESQLAMLRKLELDLDAHRKLMAHAQRRGIGFMSTPFDLASLRLLTHDLGLSRLKVPSGELTNVPLLYASAASGLPIILSTGMATLADVEQALAVLALGYLEPHHPRPSLEAAHQAYASDEGQFVLRHQVALLHCTTEYPAPLEDVNLRVMDTLAAAFGLPVGYSDHTPGITVPIAAAARGAVIIEKHFTLDRTLPGPDHAASLEPAELAQMVTAIRQVETALGRPIKALMPSEAPNRPIARKSLVAARAIAPGEPFSPDNLTVKRPGSGINAARYWDYLGKPAPRAYAPDELID